MATTYRFTWKQLAIRFIVAMILTLLTYNTIGFFSYYHWAIESLVTTGESFSVLKALVGLSIFTGWIIFLRATKRSIGMMGSLLALLFFLLLIWLMIDIGIVSITNFTVLTWFVQISIAGTLSVGMSWSHIRRRMSGQLDVDETDTHE